MLLVLEAEEAARGLGFANATAQSYAISLALSFLVKDPLIALLIALLPTRAARRQHKVMDVVADALSRSPVELVLSLEG